MDEVRDELTAINCNFCGIWFGISKIFESYRRKDAKQFCCPNGCKVHFAPEEETDLDRSRERNARLAWENDQLKAQVKEYEYLYTAVTGGKEIAVEVEENKSRLLDIFKKNK